MTGKGIRTISIGQSVLGANDRAAALLRQRFLKGRTFVLNLISSPGAGKTSLIEKTVARLGDRVLVIEGDPYTCLDSDRINVAGARAIQINTRGGCHLDARMIGDALEGEDLSGIRLVIIENVGNLLCPAAWDLGQDVTAVVAGLTEGVDKPLKYPDTFLMARVLVINKIDLEPHLPVSSSVLRSNALSINPGLLVFQASCVTGAGLREWFEWLEARIDCKEKGVSDA